MLRSAASAGARRAGGLLQLQQAAPAAVGVTPAPVPAAALHAQARLMSTDAAGSSGNTGSNPRAGGQPRDRQQQQQQQQRRKQDQRHRQHAQKQYPAKPFTATIGNVAPAAPASSVAPPAPSATPVAPSARVTEQRVPMPAAGAAPKAPEPVNATTGVPPTAGEPIAAPIATPVAAPAAASTVPSSSPAVAAVETPKPIAPAGAAAPASPTPVPAAKPVAATPSVSSSGGGSGSKVTGAAGAASQQQSQQPPKKSGSLLSTLLKLLAGGSALVLLGLKYSTDLRDYADVHFAAHMSQLRSVLPAGFLPVASTRASVGRVGVQVGLVETVEQDVNNAVADVNKQIDSALRDVNRQLGDASRQVNRHVDTVSLEASKRIDEAKREVAKQVDEASKTIDAVVQPVRAAVEDTFGAASSAEEQRKLAQLGKLAEQQKAVQDAGSRLRKEEVKARVTDAVDSIKTAASSAASSVREVVEEFSYETSADPEFHALLRELAATERELAAFTNEQQNALRSAVLSAESDLKQRAEQRLWSMEQHQQHTLEVLAERQTRAMDRAHAHATEPRRAEFERNLRIEEENKWRRKLYVQLEDINEQLSERADQAIQTVETELQTHYTTEIARLERLAAQTEMETVRPLNQALEDARHRELRSAQAHRLSAALVELQELVSRDRVSLSSPWRVVEEIAADDYTLRQALSGVDALSIERGVLSLKALKDVFAQWLAPELKVATFMPDEPAQASVLRQVVARLFAAVTVNEAGGVILAPPSAAAVASARAAAPSLAAARRESELAHQSADYAHYINASTFLASNAAELALSELEQLHPSRRSEQLEAFIRELRRAVQVHKAVAVVKMRVLAINNVAQPEHKEHHRLMRKLVSFFA